MNLTEEQRRMIVQVANAFEAGNPYGDCGAMAVTCDGPHWIPQLVYGRCKATEYGDLRDLVRRYAEASGSSGQELGAYAARVGSEPLTFDDPFRQLLRKAGGDVVMARLQARLFDEKFLRPALAWADAAGLELPLSLLVVLDSFLSSGGVPWIIRAAFPECTPADGGAEGTWIRQYVKARHRWLRDHRLPAVRHSAWRTFCLANQIHLRNWHLDAPVVANGVEVL